MGKYINSIYAKNIGKYKEAKVKLNPRFNFLVGANGCGKTTLLKYVAIIMNSVRANVFREIVGSDPTNTIDTIGSDPTNTPNRW